MTANFQPRFAVCSVCTNLYLNLSNFHAGERELRAALDGWNQQWIDKYTSQQDIEWIFNPPVAAHMGGVWERLVRSVKKFLSVLLSKQIVGDESLLTVVAEAESILLYVLVLVSLPVNPRMLRRLI